MRPIILTLFLLVGLRSLGYTQIQPLSRSDSGKVATYLSKHHEYLSKNNYKEASRMLNDAAFIYWNHNNYNEAIQYYERSLSLNAKLENENGVAMIHNNLGMLYGDIQDYESSLKHFTKTLAARKAGHEPVGMISALINRSIAYSNLKKYDLAIEDLQQALTTARELNDVNQMKSVYGMLSETYEKKGDVEQTLKYFELYKSFHEQLQRNKVNKLSQELKEESIQKKLALAEKQAKELELLKKQMEIKEKEKEIHEVESINQNLYTHLSKKELEVTLLKREREIQSAEALLKEKENQVLKQEKAYIRNLSIIVSLSLLSIAGLLFFFLRKGARQNKRLHEQNLSIEKQKQELAHSNEVKNKIFSIIAHDLRSPISSLQSFFYIIDDFDFSEELTRIFLQLKTRLSASADLLENLLHWSRTQMQELKPQFDKVAMYEVVEQNSRLLASLAEAKSIRLSNEVPASLHALADPDMLKIVVRNLMQNAIKFTPHGGEVKISGTQLSEKIRLSITDNGIGMTQDKIDSLFDFSSNKSTYGTAKEKGTGLGIVLSAELVRISQGAIHVESQPNQGTTVELTFKSYE
ncbi:ATP-binding protein [Rapidithrix thailandica]|uniref:histidine kinase n=1 Tax=Rapidithrix thailandica TaxID=413964 RepID=A0AAW9SER7_9BACT